MINALRAEWIKLRTITSTRVLLICSFLVTLGFAVLLAFISTTVRTGGNGRHGGDGPSPDVSTMLVGLEIATTLLGVVAVLVAVGDFRFTIRPTFAAEPRRLRVFAAKSILVAAVSSVIGALMIAIALGVSSLILKNRGTTLDFTHQGKSVALGWLLYLVLYSLAGLAIGQLIRHSAGAIVTLIVWSLVLENILAGLSIFFFTWMTKWLPFSAGSRLYSFKDDTELFGRWTGGLYFAGFVALLWIAAAIFTRRRDA